MNLSFVSFSGHNVLWKGRQQQQLMHIMTDTSRDFKLKADQTIIKSHTLHSNNDWHKDGRARIFSLYTRWRYFNHVRFYFNNLPPYVRDEKKIKTNWTWLGSNPACSLWKKALNSFRRCLPAENQTSAFYIFQDIMFFEKSMNDNNSSRDVSNVISLFT